MSITLKRGRAENHRAATTVLLVSSRISLKSERNFAPA